MVNVGKVNVENRGEVVSLRALLGLGAQRSLIKADVVKKLNLQPVGGGKLIKKRSYKLFNFRVSNLDDTTNQSYCIITALEQNAYYSIKLPSALCKHLPCRLSLGFS